MAKTDIFENVTTTTGEDIKRFLRSNQSVGYLAFPSLERLLSKSNAYRPADYRNIADCIGMDRVRVYRTNRVNRAAYGNKNDGKTGDVLMLECHLHDHLCSYWSVIVHEMTHMIQDYKRMKVSRRDMEMDAHFAQSIYRKRSKAVDKANSEAVWKFDAVAQKYIDDDKYLKSLGFRKERAKLRSSLNFHYGKHSDLNKKQKQDGVIF